MIRRPIHNIAVTVGTGEFPWDMLRYDGAWPADGDTVDFLQAMASAQNPAQFVAQNRFTSNGDRRELRFNSVLFTPARWSSFMWPAREVE